MKLKIEKYPSFLSPSALMESETQPNTFYLKRLIQDGMKGDEQSLAAAVGSAFDYYVKVKLVADKFHGKAGMLPKLKNGIETNIDEAFSVGKKLYNHYMKMSYKASEYSDVELHLNKVIEGIPIYGMLDATNFFEFKPGYNIQIPFDWKVSGYTAKSGISPKPGYFFRVIDGIELKGKHKKYHDHMSLEEIDKNWATQLCTYGWIMGIKYGTPFPARIDMVSFGKSNISISKYRGWITEEFQERVISRYKILWNDILSGNFIDRLASSIDEEIIWIASTQETWY